MPALSFLVLGVNLERVLPALDSPLPVAMVPTYTEMLCHQTALSVPACQILPIKSMDGKRWYDTRSEPHGSRKITDL